MKKSRIFLMTLFIAATVISCSKNDKGNMTALLSPQGEEISVFEGANNGGNVTCDEVASATDCTFENTSGRIDYSGGEGGTTGPITWETDGTYVSWSSSIPVKVAIIVKGGPNANVYADCEACQTESSVRLSAPINPNNGKPYGLSNITFCYTECEDPLVVVLKTRVWQSPEINVWASTRGEGSDVNSLNIGFNYITSNPQSIPLYQWGNSDLQIGTIEVSDYMENEVHYLKLVIDADNDDWKFGHSWLYVGSAAGYNKYLEPKFGKIETRYEWFSFQNEEELGVRTFKIPYSEITE